MFIPRWRLRFAILAVGCAPIHPLLAQSEAEVNSGIKKFTQIYEAVEANFADKVEADQVVFKGAIPGMLHTLDPHSNFFDPKAYQLLREGQAAHYYGVGMDVVEPQGKVAVMYPIKGHPAFNTRPRPDAQINAVNNSNP